MRGYNPKVTKLLLDASVADEPKKGRSTISLDIVAMIEDIVTKNQTTRLYLCCAIAAKVATRLVLRRLYVQKAYTEYLKKSISLASKRQSRD